MATNLKTWDWALKWAGTAVTIAGAICTSVNIYPLGPVLLNLGALSWLIVALKWKEASLILINAAVLTIYTVGLLYKLVS